MTIATGVTTSSSTQVVNYSGRTAAVTFLDGDVTDISAVKITTSTVTVMPALSTSLLTISDPYPHWESSIAYTFELNTALELTTDTIALVLPTFTMGTLSAATTSAGPLGGNVSTQNGRVWRIQQD